MEGEKLTRHHRVPESRGGIRHPDNMLHIRDRKHQAFHVVFSNQTFVEQILYLRDMHGPSLSAEIVARVNALVRDFKGQDELYAYKNGVLVPEKFLESQKVYTHHNRQ